MSNEKKLIAARNEMTAVFGNSLPGESHAVELKTANQPYILIIDEYPFISTYVGPLARKQEKHWTKHNNHYKNDRGGDISGNSRS